MRPKRPRGRPDRIEERFDRPYYAAAHGSLNAGPTELTVRNRASPERLIAEAVSGQYVQGLLCRMCVCVNVEPGITEGMSGQYVQGLLYRVFVCVCVCVNVQPA